MPFAPDGSLGNVQRFGDFRVIHCAEKPHFDDARLLLVEIFEPFENFAQNKYLIGAFFDRNLYLVNRKMNRFVSALCPRVPSGVVDQNLPHQARSDAVEMTAVFPARSMSHSAGRARCLFR